VYAGKSGEAAEFVVARPAMPPGVDPSLANFVRGFTQMNASFGPGRFVFATSDCGHMRIPLRASEKGPVMSVVQTTAVLPPVDKDTEAKASPEDPAAQSRGFQALRKRPRDANERRQGARPQCGRRLGGERAQAVKRSALGA
jgi:hypothetical protein